MTPIADLVLRMAAAGAPIEAIAMAVGAIEEAQAEAREAMSRDVSRDMSRLAADRERKAKQRARQRVTGHVTGQVADGSPAPTPSPSLSPTPPITTPTPTPTLSQAEKGARGSRIPADWQLSDEDRNWAAKAGFDITTIERETAQFVDFWRARPGEKGVKLDWPATWRNWMRNSLKYSTGPPSHPAATGVRSTAGSSNGKSSITDAASRLARRIGMVEVDHEAGPEQQRVA